LDPNHLVKEEKKSGFYMEREENRKQELQKLEDMQNEIDLLRQQFALKEKES